MKNVKQQAAIAYLKDVLARKNWRPTRLANEIGARPSTINRPVSDNPGTHAVSAETLFRVREVTHVPFPTDLIAAYGFPEEYGQAAAPKLEQVSDLKSPYNHDDTPLPPNGVDLREVKHFADGPGMLDIFGAVEGGFDGAEINYEHPVERIPMPSILAGVRRACGAYVINSSMEPRYFQGEIVLINPARPVKRGHFVVVELPEHKAIVKRLLRVTDDFVELEQLNPPEKNKIPRRQVVGIYKIVGTYDE